MAATDAVKAWLSSFEDALHRQDVSAAVELFQEEECFWRDLVAFTWNIYTAESKDEVREMLEARVGEVKAERWQVDGEAVEVGGTVDALLKFETAVGKGRGHVRLKAGKCWTMFTALRELKGHEEKVGDARPPGATYGAVPGRKTWREERVEEEKKLGYSQQPYCVVVGGGQAGIALGARLRRLGVPTIIVEKNARPGDSWRNRYNSLRLHSPVWSDHMPYLPFPDNWPIFPCKDRMGDWLEAYTRLMELNYWSCTVAKCARYMSAEGRWEVVVERAGEEVTLRPAHLVLATGMSGVPHTPTFPGSQSFQGVQQHSSQHEGGDGWAGKQCIVIGSNTSAHDICADLWEKGAAQVTMVQRSSSMVVRADTLFPLCYNGLYTGKPCHTPDTADLIIASIPHKLLARLQIPFTDTIREMDASFYSELSKTGFQLDFGEDGTGIQVKYLRRGSGYYIDIGASEMIIKGEIKVKSGVSVRELQPRSVLFSDGSQLPADLIVYATGYTSMNNLAAKLISQEVADTVGKCWGLGSATARDPGPWERELRNMWKPTHQPGLWFHGGTVQENRHFSLVLALQIKARLEGLATDAYGMQPVRHLS